MSTGRSRSQNNAPFVLPAERGYLAVGVTGGIGSGKSTVCEAFAALGRLTLSADAIARALTVNDAEVLSEIRLAFGTAILTAAGTLDRKALAAVVFHDRGARERLNGIVHPRVFRTLTALLAAEQPARLRPYTIVEAALIYESGMDRGLDFVIVVDAPEEERIRRVMERDGCSREEVEARIASQMPVQKKRTAADFVLDNTGDRDTARNQAGFLDTLLRAIAQGRGIA